MEVYNETILEHESGRDRFIISTGELKWKNRLAKLCEQSPDECVCVVCNEDGSVVYSVPEKWVSVRVPRKINMTDERRQELVERMKNMRKTTE